jgi:cytochrome P450
MGGGFLDASIDTTLAAFQSMMLCLVAHPRELERATKEIDSVCADRCPQPEDLRNMPFLKACLMEVS